MNTPTPRTDAAWASSFEPCEYRAAHTARTMRECSQQLETELAALTAERDQLRAALALGQINCDAEYDDLRDERDAARARAERAEAELATERTRLDAVISNSWLVYHCSDSSFAVFSNICADYVSPWLATKRSAIDAAMKEHAK